MTMMRFLTLIFLVTSANAIFLRSSRIQERSLRTSTDLDDALSLLDMDPTLKNQRHRKGNKCSACPEKPCFTVSYFKYINPDILETEFHCTSTANCNFACLYDNTTTTTNITTFRCEEDLLYTMRKSERCELPCVKVDCEDFKMCLPLGSIVVNDLVDMNCTKPEDCPLGECRYNDQNNSLLCDDAYGSLCGYNCVEEDSDVIPFPPT